MESQKTERRVKTTIGELGARLPVGTPLADGSLAKDMISRPWKTRDEREIGRLRHEGMNQARYASLVVSQLYSQLGKHQWVEETKSPERILAVGTMYMPDVLYAFIWLRMQVISTTLKMNVKCGKCSNPFTFIGDMNSTEVYTINKLADLDWFYDLQDPINIRKKKVDRFRLQTPHWFNLEGTIKEGFNESLAKILMVRSSVVGLNDEPDLTMLVESEMDEISKRDLEAINTKINEEFIGPKMAIDGECPRCAQPFVQAIDWRGESFFTVSSL